MSIRMSSDVALFCSLRRLTSIQYLDKESDIDNENRRRRLAVRMRSTENSVIAGVCLGSLNLSLD